MHLTLFTSILNAVHLLSRVHVGGGIVWGPVSFSIAINHSDVWILIRISILGKCHMSKAINVFKMFVVFHETN